MNTLVYDFETYYAKGYTLKSMPTILYVRDPRFFMFGCAVKFNDEPAKYLYEYNECKEYFDTIDWENTIGIAYNSLFDDLILYEKFGHAAKVRCDALGLARALLPPLDRYDLGFIAPLLGLPVKGDTMKSLINVRDLTDEQKKEVADYAINDAELEYGIYKLLYPLLPDKEKEILSLTIRMGTQGQLTLCKEKTQLALKTETDNREALIEAGGISRKILGSNQQFAAYLETLGVKVPTKISLTTDEETFAFAKNDLPFLQCIADYPQYRHIFDARIATKSNTQLERAKKFDDIANTELGTCPMPYNYCGAIATKRASGAGKINVQNLKRKSLLRKALTAAVGKCVNVADSGQIELRINFWFCGQNDLLEVLRQGRCIYRNSAASTFNIRYDEVTSTQRQFGKVKELGLGYNMGGPKFRTQLAIGMLGLDPIYLTLDESYNEVNQYRETHDMITAMWKFLQERIPLMTDLNYEETYKCVTFAYEEIRLPNGLSLQFPNLEVDEDGQWTFGLGKKRKKIYGGLMLENIIQALARIVVMDQLLEIDAIDECSVVGMTHDEGIAVSPVEKAAIIQNKMISIMSTPPWWAPDLPLTAEGGFDYCYSK